MEQEDPQTKSFSHPFQFPHFSQYRCANDAPICYSLPYLNIYVRTTFYLGMRWINNEDEWRSSRSSGECGVLKINARILRISFSTLFPSPSPPPPSSSSSPLLLLLLLINHLMCRHLRFLCNVCGAIGYPVHTTITHTQATIHWYFGFGNFDGSQVTIK